MGAASTVASIASQLMNAIRGPPKSSPGVEVETSVNLSCCSSENVHEEEEETPSQTRRETSLREHLLLEPQEEHVLLAERAEQDVPEAVGLAGGHVVHLLERLEGIHGAQLFQERLQL